MSFPVPKPSAADAGLLARGNNNAEQSAQHVLQDCLNHQRLMQDFWPGATTCPAGLPEPSAADAGLLARGNNNAEQSAQQVLQDCLNHQRLRRDFVRTNLGACHTHEVGSGTNKSAKELTRRDTKIASHPVPPGDRTQGHRI